MRRLRNEGANNFPEKVGEKLGIASRICTPDDLFENFTPLLCDVPVADGREQV